MCDNTRLLGHMLEQLVEALYYKLEGHYVDSASNRNEYQEFSLG
jgi:hypothetical protein